MTADLQLRVDAALADAARITGLPVSQLKLIDAAAVTWPDGSLGCPQPDRTYTQALVPGWRVRIQAGEQVLDYHGSARGGMVLCPAGRAQPPLPGRGLV